MLPSTRALHLQVLYNLHLSDAEIAKLIHRSTHTVIKIRLKHLGKKRKNGSFNKGHKPWNKGVSLKGNHLFQKGHTLRRTIPMYSTFTRTRKGIEYTFICTPECREYSYARYLYEQHHQVKLTSEQKVVFWDKDRKNFDISNLIVLTNRDLAQRNRNPAKGHESRKQRLKEVANELEEYGIKGNQTF